VKNQITTKTRDDPRKLNSLSGSPFTVLPNR